MMHNPQFNQERNSSADIAERLRMEIHDFYHAGPPDDDANLIQLLEDARDFIVYLCNTFGIKPADLVVPQEE